ncbi:MAG: putative sporulation protein YtxC [Firmicutes bacterium]|nr:putative sporulation protein YtxC [Bacillota bacterium]
MAQGISIVTEEHPDAVRQRLTEELNQLKNEGLEVRISETMRGQATFLGCNIVKSRPLLPPGEAQLVLRYFVANALADEIVSTWEETLVREIVREECHHFSSEERRQIAQLVLQKLGETWGEDEASLALRRRGQIARKLLEYLETADFLVLEGFIRFRLAEYRDELRELVNKAADDFVVDKEYQEFIRLLRYFVDLQGPQLPEIQVLITKDEKFALLDAQNRPLSTRDLAERTLTLEEDDLNYGDLLISTLIAISPTHITLHLGQSSVAMELVNTIQDVFVGRVDICTDCPLCQQSLQ